MRIVPCNDNACILFKGNGGRIYIVTNLLKRKN